MCNRYTAIRRAQIREMLALQGIELPEDWTPYINISPTSVVPVVRIKRDEKPRGVLLKWGTLLPTGLVMNARAETFEAKRAWSDAVAHRRCLMPADGFFEFETVGRTKLPHYFTVRDQPAFFIAGLWLEATAQQPERVVMVTTEPNSLVAPFHDRMPAILSANSSKAWLGYEPLNPGRLRELCASWPADRLAEHRVSTKVNSVKYQELDSTEPLRELTAEERGELF